MRLINVVAAVLPQPLQEIPFCFGDRLVSWQTIGQVGKKVAHDSPRGFGFGDLPKAHQYAFTARIRKSACQAHHAFALLVVTQSRFAGLQDGQFGGKVERVQFVEQEDAVSRAVWAEVNA